jgi:hypothetical protein
LDRYRLYLTIEFVTYCWNYKVLLFFLSVYSIYLLQLLDIRIFQVFKKYYQNILDIAIRYSSLNFKYNNFLAAFQRIYNRTFKIGTIKSVFKKTGLYFFDSKLVLVTVSIPEDIIA